MTRAGQLCPVCENYYIWGSERQCDACDERDRREELETRLEVMTLNEVDDLEGLKQWIKEYLIK